MKKYDHLKIEKKWQKEWDSKKVYKTLDSKSAKSKKLKPFYVLGMFPYPSGAGLHVGHPRSYIGSDICARMKRMQGFNVLYPMGYDAFGLPAEQYAIEHNVHPREAVEKNIKTFRGQFDKIGFSFDWSRQVNTTDTEYYKWTQWIFLKLYNSYYDKKSNKARPISELIKKLSKEDKEWKNYDELKKQDILMNYRLAYEGESEVNWCQVLGTVLANDEIVDDAHGHPVSERGGYPVEKIRIKQWFLRITSYADRLIEGLPELKWSNHLKEIQKNWIGKSEGSLIKFPLFKLNIDVEVFTTRADTLFGVTYVVLAPEHPLILNLKNKIENWKEVEEYIEHARHKENQERMDETKEKTGVELKVIKAINPANNEEVPVWISDYVLADYGTGAVMAVPMHDERDRQFSNKYHIPIIDRPLVDKFEITEKVGGKIVTKYKMRDAVFARQRYWGEPIPLYRDKKGIIHEVKKLPLELPNVKSYEPTGHAEGPLAGVKAWVAKGYETNTMPGWAGSSWYFLRYMDPKNKKELASKKELDYWKQVDMYVGGAEHATGHLLYSRFWHKFLKDIGVVKTEEPFVELHNQGLIMATDGRKMSKRWGNVVNPDDIVKVYGADTLRVYEMFMGPFDQPVAWSTESIIGSRRFLEKVWRISQDIVASPSEISSRFTLPGIPGGTHTIQKSHSALLEKLLHKTIKKVTEDIANFNFNTAISSMMILVNEMEKSDQVTVADFKMFLQLLAPFAPYIAEDIWKSFGEKKSIHISGWPKYDKNKIKDDVIKIAVQVNGKVRAEIEFAPDSSEADIKEIVLSNEAVKSWIKGGEIKRFIYIKNKLVNIVV